MRSSVVLSSFPLFFAHAIELMKISFLLLGLEEAIGRCWEGRHHTLRDIFLL